MLNCTLNYALYILSVDAQWSIAARKFPSAMAFFPTIRLQNGGECPLAVVPISITRVRLFDAPMPHLQSLDQSRDI